MSRELGGHIAGAFGLGGRSGDVWENATAPPSVEAPECEWCPVCRAARRLRVSGPGLASQVAAASDALATMVQDAMSVVESALAAAGRRAGPGRPEGGDAPAWDRDAAAAGWDDADWEAAAGWAAAEDMDGAHPADADAAAPAGGDGAAGAPAGGAGPADASGAVWAEVTDPPEAETGRAAPPRSAGAGRGGQGETAAEAGGPGPADRPGPADGPGAAGSPE